MEGVDTVISLIKSNTRLSDTILKFEINLKKTAKARITKGFLDAKTKIASDYFTTFQDVNSQIVVLIDPAVEKKSDYYTQGIYDRTEDAYSNIITFINEKMNELLPPNASAPSSPIQIQNNSSVAADQLIPTAPRVKLPTITIPEFDGSYETWPSFYDRFKSLIHDNNTISAVNKLHYLKTNLSGEAELLLRHYSITTLNYNPAWELLVNRYNNKRILVNVHLKTLFNQPRLTQDSSQGIKRLLYNTIESVQSLRNIGVDTGNWDVLLNYLVIQRLTTESHLLWEQSLESSRDLPTFEQLKDFLENRYRALELTSSKPSNTQAHVHSRKQQQSFSSTISSQCVICSGNHSVRICGQFKKMSVESRAKTAANNALCTNCLSTAHSNSNCPSQKRCFKCKSRHHTMLHVDKPQKVSESTRDIQQPSTSTGGINSFHANSNCQGNNILLATAMVKVSFENDNDSYLHALLDQGSQASFITEAACQRLHLKRQRASATVKGIGDGHTMVKGQVALTLNAHFQSKLNLPINAFILRSLTQHVPSSFVHTHSWEHVAELTLADPEFFKPSVIDLVLGADVYSRILLDGVRHGLPSTPVAQKTKLGWILSGPTHGTPINPNQNIVSLISYIELDHQLMKFWELEEVPAERSLTADELKCEQLFEKTFKRDDLGRCMVKLPFVDDYGHGKFLGESKPIAKSRFQQIERSLQRKPSIYRSHYIDCMQDYINLNHMELIDDEIECRAAPTSNGKTKSFCYLPHHGVTKESSTTTKLRVVFDASQKTQSGLSLNDVLLTGPRLQDELISIISRWRKFKYAVTADIQKMYRQIRVYPDDAEYQRLLWRPNSESQVCTYRLLTLTFGTSSAPYLAIKSLQHLATLEQSRYPLAAQAIMNHFYVDDLLAGADGLSDAEAMQTQLVTLLQSAGFNLRKWMSNNLQLLNKVPIDDRETTLPLSFDQDDTIKTLGLHWHPTSDVFQFQICLAPTPTQLTKRNILSDVAKLFDPSGWLAPVTIKAKIILQSLWLTGLGWDDHLPNNIIDEWNSYRSELHHLDAIKINRWIDTTGNSTSIQLHCFCDASTHAFAASIYVRSKREDGHISVHLLNAKTKVAPIKPVSLARLELCAALLGARLLARTVKDMQWPHAKLYAWSDSTIVLAWLKGHPHRWNTFVANRVSEIHQKIPNSSWNHVPGNQNPVDCASRGIAPSTLQTHALWWQGPLWLSQSEVCWPISIPLETTTVEQKTSESTISFNAMVVDNDLNVILQRFSSFTKANRCTAYCFRFIHNMRNHQKKRGIISTAELDAARIFWVKHVQTTEFRVEILALSRSKQLHSGSKLLNLNPFLDNSGMLRVGGRLEQSALSFDAKHPLVLPKQHHLTMLIVTHYHLHTLHGGPQVTLSMIRQKYWILDPRNTVRHIIHRCVICYRYRASAHTQLMGQLPSVRITASRPFEHTGVDYAGPIEVKATKLRGSKMYKAYISLFVCLSVKCIHLELVTDLTTEGFIAAYRRFTSRRGLVSSMYSDCGTNFVGAARRLKRDFDRAVIENDMAEILANDNTEWHFIPPGAPNFGGLWEAGVKSVKNHLKRLLGNSNFTYEELSTCLIQIEAVLNSRPLCPLSNNPNDLAVLTPGHFLIGSALLAPPQPSLLKTSTNRLNRWQQIQQRCEGFWRKWHLEYLANLQQRPKWNRINRNVAVDDMVLVKDDRMPPQKWLLGRITKTTKGLDDLVRVADIKTPHGIITRAISKIVMLPFEHNQ